MWPGTTCTAETERRQNEQILMQTLHNFWGSTQTPYTGREVAPFPTPTNPHTETVHFAPNATYAQSTMQLSFVSCLAAAELRLQRIRLIPLFQVAVCCASVQPAQTPRYPEI